MNRQSRFRILLLTLAAGLTLLLALGVVIPRIARSDASGCSRYDDARPVYGGCRNSRGSACYYCEYARSGGGFSMCGESVDGSISFCIDYDDIPF